MAIDTFRLFIKYDCLDDADDEMSRGISINHFGVNDWFRKKIRLIKKDLKGMEVEKIDIVNIFFCESNSFGYVMDKWHQLGNSLQCNLIYDVRALVGKDPLDNVKALIQICASVSLKSEWPQIQAIGQLISLPLRDSDFFSIQIFLDKYKARF